MSDEFYIKIEELLQGKSNQQLAISVRFIVPYLQQGITVQDAKVLKHIIVVVTRGGNYHAAPVFNETIVFQDDIKDYGDKCSGSFDLNVSEKLEFDGPGEYYILCSLGTYVSNIIKIIVSENRK